VQTPSHSVVFVYVQNNRHPMAFLAMAQPHTALLAIAQGISHNHPCRKPIFTTIKDFF